MNRFKELSLAKMFSIIIFSIAFIVSTAIQSVKYYQSKIILDDNLASKANVVLDFANSAEKEKSYKVESGDTFYNVFNPSASNLDLTEKEIVKVLKNTPEKTFHIKTEKEYVYARWNGENKIAYVKLSLADYQKALRNLIVSSVILWIINISILLTMINFLFRKLIVNRINEILEIIGRVSKGNFIDEEIFDKKKLNNKSKNEIDKIYISLHEMIQSLKPVIEDVIKNSKEVVFESLYGYGKVKDNVTLIRKQNSIVKASNESISNIMQMSVSLDERLHELLEKSDKSVQAVQQGMEIVNTNITSSEAVIDSMQNTMVLVEELKEFAQDISQTLSKISDIANETNLISLNAAIEAARAGEHGRGFAVVAEKIRQLADISLENATQINSVIGAIQKNIDSVAYSANRTNEIIQKLGSSSEVLEKNFKVIDLVIQDTGDTLKSFGKDFIVQEKHLQSVQTDLKQVNESSFILDNNSGVVEESINSITQLSAHLQNVSDKFDVMVDKRKSVRKLIVPPITVQVTNGKYIIDCYVYDISEGGISLIVTKKDPRFVCEIGAVYRLKTIEKKMNLDGRQIEMVYLFNKKDETTMRVGAKFV
jgi:methyl-accepting chemotaxis protein